MLSDTAGAFCLNPLTRRPEGDSGLSPLVAVARLEGGEMISNGMVIVPEGSVSAALCTSL